MEGTHLELTQATSSDESLFWAAYEASSVIDLRSSSIQLRRRINELQAESVYDDQASLQALLEAQAYASDLLEKTIWIDYLMQEQGVA